MDGMSTQLRSSASSAYAAAAAVEQALGDPFDPESVSSFAASVRADEEEAPPLSAFATLRELGVHRALVPEADGGSLTSFDDLLMLSRLLARRDLVLTVGVGSTFLASVPVWLWGDAEQRARAAEVVLGGGWATLGVTEDTAGSDLVATGTRAERIDGGFRLDGEKWLVGNARRAGFYVVLAQSDPSFGLFMVEPDRVRAGTLRRLDPVRTLGLRAHDLSGFALEDCVVGEDAPVGRVGRGLEMVASTLQFTRTLVSGMCLGGADTALRIAVGWARSRRLYGAPIFELPPVRRLLAGAFADLLTCECVATAAARGLNVAPHRMSLWSAVAKYVVPSLSEQIIRDSAEVLSARNYLREGVAAGAFQKLARDVAITTVFEGTQLVVLETIRAQLAHGARRRAGGEEVSRADLFAPGAPLPAWAPQERRPSLSYGGVDEVVDGLDEAVEEVRAAGPPELATLAVEVLAAREQTRRDLAALMAGGAHRTTTHGYDLARAHCLVHAAACCLLMWLERGGDADWVVLSISRLLHRLGRACPAPGDAVEQRRAAALAQLAQDGRLLSLLDFPLAPTTTRGAP